jgi:hypothetical protein
VMQLEWRTERTPIEGMLEERQRRVSQPPRIQLRDAILKATRRGRRWQPYLPRPQ